MKLEGALGWGLGWWWVQYMQLLYVVLQHTTIAFHVLAPPPARGQTPPKTVNN
jgi:hypothetical protein